MFETKSPEQQSPSNNNKKALNSQPLSHSLFRISDFLFFSLFETCGLE